MNDVDPVFDEIDNSIKTSRAQLAESRAAADDSWAMLQGGKQTAIAAMQAGVDGAWKRLQESDSG